MKIKKMLLMLNAMTPPPPTPPSPSRHQPHENADMPCVLQAAYHINLNRKQIQNLHFDVYLEEQTLLNKTDDKCYTVHLQCFNCLSILFCPLFNFSVLFVTHSIPLVCIVSPCRCLCICMK